jgi:hypothetical protein
MKVGNRRAPARGGHGTHWREGVARVDASGEGNIVETQNSVAMYTQLDPTICPEPGEDPCGEVVNPLDEPAAGNLHGVVL